MAAGHAHRERADRVLHAADHMPGAHAASVLAAVRPLTAELRIIVAGEEGAHAVGQVLPLWVSVMREAKAGLRAAPAFASPPNASTCCGEP